MYEAITLEELNSVEIESPISDTEFLEVEAFDDPYSKAAKVAEEEGSPAAAKVFRLFATLCSFHFKPGDKAEPFNCHINFGDGRRTLIGSDFSNDELEALEAQIPRIGNLALRTRVSDLVWWRDKSKQQLGRQAIDGYVELISVLNSGKGKLRFERSPENSLTVQNYLVRALEIARTTGWAKSENDTLRLAAQTCLELAAKEGGMALVRFSGIIMHLRLEASDVIFDSLDEAAQKMADSGDFHAAEELAKLSIRRANMKRDDNLVRERSIKLSNLLVLRAEKSDSAFLKSHALQQAYEALESMKGVREERAKVHDLLKASQVHMYEEMGHFEESIDISDEVEHFRSLFDNLDLLDCLRTLALIELPKHPEKLQADANELISKHPLTSLFPSSILDAKGRTVAKVSGSDGGNDDALRHQVIKSESLRAGLAVGAAIYPALEIITSRFTVSEDLLFELCKRSPFVPAGSEHLFAIGMSAFIYGDQPVAVSMLIPLLEAGMRAMVGAAGRTDTKLLQGGIEEVIGISAMLANHKDVLEQVLTPAIVHCIDNFFVHEFGPKIRHSVCHGLSRDEYFHSDVYVYATKFIFSLVLLPLIHKDRWPQIKEDISARLAQADWSNPAVTE